MVEERDGIQVEAVLVSGALPFRTEKIWTLPLPDKDVIVFGLLDHSVTAVYTLRPGSKSLSQVPTLTSDQSTSTSLERSI